MTQIDQVCYKLLFIKKTETLQLFTIKIKTEGTYKIYHNCLVFRLKSGIAQALKVVLAECNGAL